MDLTTGQNLLKQKKFLMALKHFKKLLELNPNNIDINFYLGRAYSEIQAVPHNPTCIILPLN